MMPTAIACLFVLLAPWLSPQAWAQATYSTVASVRIMGDTTDNELQTNFTCTNSNTAVYVAAHIRETTSAATTITAITYNGLTLANFTEQVSNTTPNSGTRVATLSVWRALPAGACDGAAHTMTVTLSAPRIWGFGVISVTGVNLSTPNDTPVTNETPGTGEANPSTGNVASATGDLVLGFVVRRNTESLTSGQTSRYNINNTTTDTSDGVRLAGATEPGAATVNMTWTQAVTNQWVTVGINVNQFAISVTRRRRTLIWD